MLFAPLHMDFPHPTPPLFFPCPSHSSFYTKVSRLQLDLGQIQLFHHRDLKTKVYDPIGQTMDEVFPVKS